MSSFFIPNLLSEAYGVKLSITEIRCKNHLPNYIKLGEINYKERYKNNRVVDNCIKLFKDSKSGLYFDPSKVIITKNSNTSFKMIYDKLVGEKYHIIKYQVCNNEEKTKQKILFQSSSEKSLIILPKYLAPNQCTYFWTEVVSGNVDSITISWDTGNEKSLKIRKTFR
ncbi:hypothetical protein C5F50_06870 [Nitrosopumilus ureiphilus]|uniref:Uncharacterized protein n=2 Tax=Nitrosopumilus ureiphilus TaxID=1470067 RepID=A0A7D5MA50_9ARCH|nr:hypothetical protein C5F50_06870 [Nitrosopumilus ureiphilus]